jgi:epoxyqueuosine reductase
VRSLAVVSQLVAQIKNAARELGFDVVGIASVKALDGDDQAFRAWREAGFAAEMNYMTRRTQLHAHPKTLVPEASSIITLAINYYVAAPVFQPENRYGRVARYAWGLDYHGVVKARLLLLAGEMEKLAGRKIQSRCFVDAVPLLERAVAASAGVGFFGKNTNLLQANSGSWFFLSEILVDLALPADERQVKIGCGTCHRCLDACPTNAFAGAYKLDSRRCISYLTIENKGAIPIELRDGLGAWIFGCDICQEMRPEATRYEKLPPIIRGQSELVCPFNRFAKETTWKEFHPEYGAGVRLDLVEILSIKTDEEFGARFKGTPLTRPKRRGLLRNAAVAARNIECTAAIPVLIERIRTDPEPLIRSHALWALAYLDRQKAKPLIEQALADPDIQVREEAILLKV